MRRLFEDLTARPALPLLFLGLLMPLGAASEEVTRVFLLSRVWKACRSAAGRLAGVLTSAGLFALVHAYQGPAHVAWASGVGLIMALWYLRFGRVAPLIFAHYATNALQVLVFAARAR